MRGFVSRKLLYRKLTAAAGFMALIGVGLYVFDTNSDFILNLKPYYLKSYQQTLPQKLEQAGQFLGSLIPFFKKEPRPLQDQEIAGSVPVLLYHGIIDQPDGTNVLLDNFADQMRSLKQAGYHTITINDFYEFRRGEKILYGKPVLITFDDGRKDSYYPVDPILEAMGFNAVMYVISGHVERVNEFYLSYSELQRMKLSNRWDLQSHGEHHDFYEIDSDGTTGHYIGNKLWLPTKQRLETEDEFRRRIRDEFVKSKTFLEKTFKDPIVSYAFPFGEFAQNSRNFPESKGIVLDEVRKAYPLVFYQTWRANGFTFNDADGNFFVKRITVDPKWTGNDLMSVLESGSPKKIPFSDMFEKDRGWWVTTLGETRFSNTGLELITPPNKTGVSVLLNGSSLWGNYTFRATLDWMRGQNVILSARFKDESNFAACTFGGVVRAEQRVGGVHTVLAESPLQKFEHGPITLEVIVLGNEIQCFANGTPLVRASLDASLSNGGIAIKTWDSKPGFGRAVVKNVEVRALTSLFPNSTESILIPN